MVVQPVERRNVPRPRIVALCAHCPPTLSAWHIYRRYVRWYSLGLGGPLMRLLLALLAASIAMMLRVEAQEASAYKVDEAVISQCVETAEKAWDQAHADVRRRCIGVETEKCLRDTDQNTYESNRRMFCSDAEAEAWRILMERAYAALLERYEKWDGERSKVQTGVVYEPVVPAVRRAHEAWMVSQDRDCEYASIEPGTGTNRYDEPARCRRNGTAERALLYRRWTYSR